MSDETGTPFQGHSARHEAIGSIAEEATRLVGALVDWAKSSNFSQAGEVISSLPIATGSDECAICPVCQVLHIIKGQKPEVYDHLQSAALSMMLAAKAAFDAVNPAEEKPKPGAERININFGSTDKNSPVEDNE